MSKPIRRHTQRRGEWLEYLEREGRGLRAGWGRVACDCGRLGWSKWVDLKHSDYEELTDEGRRMLAE